MILLVRHGRTPTTGKVLPGRAPGLHLSDEGRAEADAVATRIAALRTDGRRAPVAVYASPLDRTMETAQPIAKAVGLRVRREPGLLDCDFGTWAGARLAVLARRREWPQVQRWPSGFRFPGGESFAEMQARVTDTLARLCERHRGETIVAVSHADTIKAAIADAAGTHLDLFQRFVVNTCSVSTLAFGPGGPHVLGVNSTSALSELAIA